MAFVSVTCLCGSIGGAIGSKVYAAESNGRVEYLNDVYTSLSQVLSYLIYSGEMGDEGAEFLKAVEKHLDSPLEFVRDDQAFVIDDKEKSRLMRSPKELRSSIFINEVLLNSSEFNLDLPQLIKLFLHELGHKTEGADRALTLDQRDQWAQKAESLLRPFVLRSNDVEKTAGESIYQGKLNGIDFDFTLAN